MFTEKIFTYNGHECVITRNTRIGFLCGYVSVDATCEDDCPAVWCHGGVTYYGTLSTIPERTKSFYIGFDCAHSGDTPEECDLNFCVLECMAMVDQL